jgi:hypothetical protein
MVVDIKNVIEEQKKRTFGNSIITRCGYGVMLRRHISATGLLLKIAEGQ